MRFSSPKIIYLIFFISGLAGLVYEIVWGRLLVLIFGSTTNSIVAVIAAFLGGLALGSLIFGKIADRLSTSKLINTYSILEFGIGASALLSLFLIPRIKFVYSMFSDGSGISPEIIVIKFALSILVLLIPTTLMGGTLPILVRAVTAMDKSLEKSVSYLYAVNTFGAVFGVILSAYFFIELLGLTNTLMLAALINFSLAFIARFIKFSAKEEPVGQKSEFREVLTSTQIVPIAAFGISGLVSIAYEVLWTRILTASLGNFIYAFATILGTYLIGIAVGSLLYGLYSRLIKGKNIAFGLTEAGIGFFALLSVYLTSNQVVLAPRTMMILVIFPASVFMGLTFPAVIALISKPKHSGKIVGVSYFANTIGSIIGGFITSFLLLPFVGSTQSVVLLTIVNFTIAFFFVLREPKTRIIKIALAGSLLILVISTSWLFTQKRHSLFEKTTQWRKNWAEEKGIEYSLREDEVASVFAYHDVQNNDQNLFIDGIPTTGKIGETKLMAHIPILLHPDPHDVLVIAFGMGTTFRSSINSGYSTDVVELVPSVPPLMYLFHPDAQKVQSDPKAKIIVNDGRNYIYLTKKHYDIVIIDPPPPFNAAGTTVLYSEEFYKEIALKLNPGGIVSQWIWFGSREDDISMAIKSFTNVFPHILAFRTPDGAGGVFLQGSLTPIKVNKVAYEKKLENENAKADLAEIYKDLTIEKVLDLVIGDRESLLKVIDSYPSITDDRPVTEYFKLRHKYTKSTDLPGTDWGREYLNKLKSTKPISF